MHRVGRVGRHRTSRFVLHERQRSGPVEAEIEADELVRDAAASCPSEAISLVDADTGQPVDLD